MSRILGKVPQALNTALKNAKDQLLTEALVKAIVAELKTVTPGLNDDQARLMALAAVREAKAAQAATPLAAIEKDIVQYLPSLRRAIGDDVPETLRTVLLAATRENTPLSLQGLKDELRKLRPQLSERELDILALEAMQEARVATGMAASKSRTVADIAAHLAGSRTRGGGVPANNTYFVVVNEGENVFRLYKAEVDGFHPLETIFDSLAAAKEAAGPGAKVFEAPLNGLQPAGNLGEHAVSGLPRFDRRIGEVLNGDGHLVVVAGDTNVQSTLGIPSSKPVAEHIALTERGGFVVAEGKRAGKAIHLEQARRQFESTASHLRAKVPGAKIEAFELIIASEAEIDARFRVVDNQLHKVIGTTTEVVKVDGIPITVRRISRQ